MLYRDCFPISSLFGTTSSVAIGSSGTASVATDDDDDDDDDDYDDEC